MMKKWLGVLSSVAVLIGGLTMTTAQPAAAAASVTLDKSAPGSVLLGDPVPYTLTASNPAGNDPLYNVSFSDVLPAGFEYVGPTTPASAGEPTVTQTSSGQTLLVWNNVTDLQATPLHVVFDTCVERATVHGLRVTGSELVGMVPRAVLLAAGRHYLTRMGRSTGVPESYLVHVACRTLGLSEVKAFDPAQRVIEYRLTAAGPLAASTLTAFADELSSDSPAPGGGSVAALAGALAAGLAAMVANLAHPKRGFEDRRESLDRLAVEGQQLKDQLLAAVDADTAAFDAYLAALRMPSGSPEQAAARHRAVTAATIGTIEVPMITLEAAPRIARLCIEAARSGMPSSLSDAGTGAALALAAASGAYQNVCINLPGLADDVARAQMLDRADAAWQKTQRLVHEAGALTVTALRAAAGPGAASPGPDPAQASG